MNKTINLQIIKVYPLQKNSLISICLHQSEHQERLYFGTSQEPSNRLSAFHDLNIFVKKSFYFLHRNSQEIYQGLIPILYGSFYRNQFTNMLFYGPPGIVQFLIEIRFIIGIRHLAFAGYDLQQKKKTLEKYGVGNRSQFIQALKDYQASQLIDKPLPVLNEYVERITTDIVKPSEYIENDSVSCSFANIVPLYSQNNNNVIQYLILFKKSKTVNLQWFQSNKIDHANIKQGEFIDNNQQNDNSLLAQAMLILNFENEQEITQFKCDSLNDQLIQYSKQINKKQRLIIIHDSSYALLKCQIYKDLLNQLKKLTYNITHIVTSNEVYQELPKEAIKDLGRERKGYYYLDYLECMKNILPTYFKGRTLVNQFEKNQNLHNINELWKEEDILLPMKMKTMQIEDGQIYYENIKIDRSVQFSPKSEILQLLSRLHNIQQNNYNQNDSTFKLTVFGTASSCETQSRCTSSWYVELQDIGVLLDCGQNALSQLYFSSENDEEFEDKIRNIKIIYISHFHNDHNQGLMDFLGKKCQISKDQCYVILPNNLFQWYDQQLTQLFQDKFSGEKYYDYIKIVNTKQLFSLHEQEHKLKYTPFKLQNLESQRTPRSVSAFGYHNKRQDELFQNNFIQFKQLLSTHNVQIQLNYSYHCEEATNIKLIYNNKSLVYSSDRLGAFDINAKKFIEFSKDCDILIHECTFPDNLNDRAYTVLHSTFLQALLTAQSANAKNLILTHYTDRLLFNIKNLMDFEGTIDKVQFANNIKLNTSWPEQINVDKLYTYFKNKTVFANDFQIFTDQSIPQLPQISRIIVKMLQP